MIDARHRRRGYGRAAVAELIRRLKMDPGVRLIATNYMRSNEASRRLFAGLGFGPDPRLPDKGDEVFVALDWQPD